MLERVLEDRLCDRIGQRRRWAGVGVVVLRIDLGINPGRGEAKRCVHLAGSWLSASFVGVAVAVLLLFTKARSPKGRPPRSRTRPRRRARRIAARSFGIVRGARE